MLSDKEEMLAEIFVENEIDGQESKHCSMSWDAPRPMFFPSLPLLGDASPPPPHIYPAFEALKLDY
jgi:hypothetical protein